MIYCLQVGFEARGYRLADGSQSGVHVTVCADPKAQRLMEQIRENETQQAIDRIRLIHNEVPKHVYILSSLPVDIDIDQLLSLKQMRTDGSHIEQIVADWSGQILPLSPTFLWDKFPEHFKTHSAAKHAATELLKLSKSSETFNGSTFKSPSLNRSFNIWTYRIKNAKGHHLKTIAPIGAHPIEVRFLLEKQHGNSIIIKTQDERLSPSYRNQRRFRDLTPRVYQHQNYDFEYIDHLEVDPDIPGGWYVSVQ